MWVSLSNDSVFSYYRAPFVHVRIAAIVLQGIKRSEFTVSLNTANLRLRLFSGREPAVCRGPTVNGCPGRFVLHADVEQALTVWTTAADEFTQVCYGRGFLRTVRLRRCA